jgi:hypothetical protein
MAFPGDRRWKLKLTIPHENILGDIVNDGLFRVTHVTLPDEFLTLDGEQAPQDGGTDIAASSDALGTTQIPCHVVRCALNATPADSRVQIWFRRQDVEDANDTDIWLWWGSETETAPAVDADYGRNDVFDGTTGTGSPVAAWGVWLFDEDPTDPAPCYTDYTGNGHSANDTGSVTRADAMDVRGMRPTGGYALIPYTWAPGTGDFSVLWAAAHDETYNCYIDATPDQIRISSDIGLIYDGTEYCTTGALTDSPCGFGVYRDGDTITLNAGTPKTGNSGFDFTLNNPSVEGSAATCTFVGFFDTAINSYWFRSWRDCLVAESTFWEVGAITAAAVQAVYTVSPIAVGSEVRYYEQPHPQQWTIDFAGLAVADQDGTYFLFQVMGSGGASDHYAWFDLDNGSTDPEVSGRTGHEIDVATGDDDEDIAAAAATVLAGVTGLDATVSGTVVTVTNERDGELEPPADATRAVATGADIDTVVLGGTSDDEITGVETSTGTSWGGVIAVTRPRMVTIVIIRPGYEPVRLEGYVVQPANTLVPVSQRVDLNYWNPT